MQPSLQSILKCRYWSQKKLCPLVATPCFSTSPSTKQPLIYFLTLGFPPLDISYKWDLMICGLFIFCDVFKVYPCCIISQYFFSFYSWVIFHYTDRPHFVYPFIDWWTFEVFPLFCSYEWCYCEHSWKFLCGYITRSGLAGSCGPPYAQRDSFESSSEQRR